MVDVSSGINSEASSRFLSCVQCPVTTVELELSVNCVSRESGETQRDSGRLREVAAQQQTVNTEQ